MCCVQELKLLQLKLKDAETEILTAAEKGRTKGRQEQVPRFVLF
jgi:hypothetical protein